MPPGATTRKIISFITSTKISDDLFFFFFFFTHSQSTRTRFSAPLPLAMTLLVPILCYFPSFFFYFYCLLLYFFNFFHISTLFCRPCTSAARGDSPPLPPPRYSCGG